MLVFNIKHKIVEFYINLRATVLNKVGYQNGLNYLAMLVLPSSSALVMNINKTFVESCQPQRILKFKTTHTKNYKLLA